MQPVVLLCFTLSGISGLMLEIVWTRHLEHVFGATTLAVATVLTCFMGGLALGSWLFGRLADRLRQPLVTYAVLEGIVGVAAFLIPVVVHNLYPGLNRWMAANLDNSFLLHSLVRFAAVAVILILPTTCMGATLPLLSRHFMTTEGHMARAGARIGALYTVNTIGAIGGVFLATFALLPGIGLSATNTVAASINIALCLTIVALRKQLAGPPVVGAKDGDDGDDRIDLDSVLETVRPYEASRNERVAVMVAFFLSGLASMNLQVVWNRAMAMVIGSSVYSFSLVLLAFLVGLALGSAVFARLSKRIANPVMALALVELGVAVAAMGNYLYMDDLPRGFALLVTSHMEAYENHVGLVQFMMFTIAAAAVLPATFFMGATFPLTIRAVARGLGQIGRDVGSVYALNTLGAICGSFLSAFVFVPMFSRYLDGAGMQSTFFLSVAIYAGLGVLLLLVTAGPLLRRAATAATAAILAAVFFLGAPAWDPAAMTIGVFRLSLMTGALDKESWGDPDVKYYYDGVTTTVSVELWGRHFALKNNGKVDASNGDDMPTQIMIAAYPLLLHPAGPEDLDVAIVGFGSGVTVGAALEFPISRLDVVELENAVVEASRVFGSTEGERADAEFDVNHLVYRREADPETGAANPEFDWTDPDTYVINDRLRLISDDGRNFLTATPRKFDVIVSEPSNPWITGVSNMFTQESFAAMAASLKPGGVFCQWVQLYELSPENVKVILRTFASVFPYVAWFSAEDLSSDTVILGSFEPLELDLEHVREVMRDERVKAELERAYVFSAADVLARVLLVDRKEFDDYTTGLSPEPEALPVNTDDNALIEFAAPRDLISFKRFAGYLAAIFTEKWQHARLHRVVRGLGEGDAAQARARAALALSLLANGRKNEAGRFLERAAEQTEDDPVVVRAARMAALLQGQGGRPVPELEPVEPPPGMGERQATALKEQVADVLRSLGMGADRDALERFSRIPQHLWSRGGPQLLLLKGYLHFLNADPEDPAECEEAITVLSELVREDEAYVTHHPEIHFYLAMCHDNALNFDKAVKNVRRYVDLVDERDARMAIAVAQARANLEAALNGLSGTMPIELPPDPPESPTTDAAGEFPKDSWAE